MKSTGSSSSATDFGLLLLRLFLGVNLFLRHGMEKISHFSSMYHHFHDPVHIGSHGSFLFAFISDAICSVLVAIGLGTRVAAFVVFVDLAVAFYFVHHHAFSTGHAEFMLLYLGGFLALVFTGAGSFSLDWKFWERS